ncbi:unnamed protein product [Mytilus coruscus]|uniref:MEGF10_11 n=1 Tax=Mytilus coruscus TaxID=42192 RepID=A0A6J8A6N4_MYTCO|nr:unnamed protein product [Mytilus coruscus]
MDGFKLYVTNTSTIPPNGYLCYEDTDPGLPNITQIIPCNQLGKYVIYYDTKGSLHGGDRYGPIIELCYVAINGCKNSHWGSKCENVCADNCMERNCYPENGSCVWGCNPKYCLKDVCNKDTAVCTEGCKKRRTGSYCNEYNVASDGLVSLNPSSDPPASLANDGNEKSCSKTKGVNVTVQVDLMKISIGKGMYVTFGEHTKKEGHHIVYASNNSNSWNIGTVLYNRQSLPTEIKFNAVFRYLTYVLYRDQGQPSELELCEIGIYGCPPTYYGPLCNTSCPKNCRGPCDLENGICKFGCSNGWTGVECKQACQPGGYGKDCLEKCSRNCIIFPCNHVTGGCTGGCSDGWQGFNCFEKCPHGQFGRNCSQFCERCFLGMCDPVNGLCDNTSVCSPGYIYGAYCNISCDDGYFGNNCTRLCNCATGNCSAFTGNCPGGCAKGWRGEACDEVTVLLAEESSQAGAIAGSVAVVLIVLITVAALIVYKCRFISTKGKENNTEKTQSIEHQHYDDVRMEDVFTYQDLMIRQTSNEYDQINTAFVHH